MDNKYNNKTVIKPNTYVFKKQQNTIYLHWKLQKAYRHTRLVSNVSIEHWHLL